MVARKNNTLSIYYNVGNHSSFQLKLNAAIERCNAILDKIQQAIIEEENHE